MGATGSLTYDRFANYLERLVIQTQHPRAGKVVALESHHVSNYLVQLWELMRLSDECIDDEAEVKIVIKQELAELSPIMCGYGLETDASL